MFLRQQRPQWQSTVAVVEPAPTLDVIADDIAELIDVSVNTRHGLVCGDSIRVAAACTLE